MHVLACKKAARRNNAKPRPQQKAGKSHSRAVCHACTYCAESAREKNLPAPVGAAAVTGGESIKKDRQSQKQPEWERDVIEADAIYLLI